MRPAEVVRRHLAAERAAGAPFDLAWPVALTAALRDVGREEARDWRLALEWARPAFEAAYHGEDAEPATVAAAELETMALAA